MLTFKNRIPSTIEDFKYLQSLEPGRVVVYSEWVEKTFSDGNLGRVRFDSCSFFGCAFRNVHFKDTKFLRTRFYRCNFIDCTFDEVELHYSDLLSTTFTNCSIRMSSFSCGHYSIKFEQCTISVETSFENIEFSTSDFEGCKIESSVEFWNCNMLNVSNFPWEKRLLYRCSLPIREEAPYQAGKILTSPIIGYRTATIQPSGDKAIVELRIPEGAIVFQRGENFRCNKAEVLKMFSLTDESLTFDSGVSNPEGGLVLTVGSTVEVKDFDMRYNYNLGNGIFFDTELERVKFGSVWLYGQL